MYFIFILHVLYRVYVYLSVCLIFPNMRPVLEKLVNQEGQLLPPSNYNLAMVEPVPRCVKLFVLYRVGGRLNWYQLDLYLAQLAGNNWLWIMDFCERIVTLFKCI